MKKSHLIQVSALVLLALVLVAGCAPAPTQVPTPVPTFTSAVQEETPAATSTAPTLVVPSATPVTATATAAAAVTDTPAPTDVPATATETSVPAAPTETTAPLAPTNTNTPVPTATPAPTNTPVPTATRVPPSPTAVQITDWRGEYYDNPALQGDPDLVRNDRVVDFDLDAGERPAAGIPAENWSARWSRQWTFDTGNYRFQLLVDDGARLWVNNNLLIDAWEDGAPREFAANLYLSGQASIRLEYYNRFGQGRVRLNWVPVTEYPEWRGSYYPVRDLSGAPRFERNDPAIDFNWGAGSPRHDIPAENFAVRWTRRLQLSQGGTYRFVVVSDDGARLWIDGQLIIDSWRDGYTTDEATIALAAGGHDVRLEFYEHLGGALIRLTWSQIPATATSTVTTAPPTNTPTATGIPPTRTTVPPTATSTRVPTGVPPTATATVPAAQPSITLQPPSGTLGDRVTVTGQGYPANAQVDIVVGVSGQDTSSFFKVGETVTGPDGRFQAQITLPAARDWQGAGALQVIAQVPGQSIVARATFTIQARAEPGPQVGTVPFVRIPTNAARFVLPRPTFLVLDSAEAWAAHFGQEPAPDSPVNWQQEYVLGAFMVPQGARTESLVQSIQVQGNRVIVRLAAAAPTGGDAFTGTLVRVSRSALGITGQPTFTFVDARGQVLALGQPSAAPLSLPLGREAPRSEVPGVQTAPGEEPEEEAAALAAPAPEEEGAALAAPAPEEESALSKEIAPEEVAPQEEAVPQAQAGAEPAQDVLPEAAGGGIAETRAQVRDVTWQQSALAWLALLAWGILIVLIIGGVFLLVRRAVRRS
ncbi:MAG TPA: PA14 domain-containing protein [Anaerolineae bacterium]|nr:PA14 domain-containing protein [Anaerolineae bacterium]